MPRSSRTLQQRLTEGVVVGAEGYVFELERRGYIKAGPFVPEVILDAPDALAQLHREFLRAGADVMVALTYYAHRDKLRAIGREGELEAMNRAAVRIANAVAAEGDALVAGNISNTWSFDPKDPVGSGAVVREQYREQLGWAVGEGIDFVIAETNDYVGEAVIALEVCQELGLPAMVTFASVQPERTYDGYDYVDACRVLADKGAALVGLNCSRGPETMLPLLERICAAVDVPVAAQPVPYRTTARTPAFESLELEAGRRAFPIELEPFGLTRFEMADFARRARDIGVRYVGICCGGAPHHVRAMAEALGRTPPASRYSPAMSLHPVLGDDPQDTMGGWSAPRGADTGSSGVEPKDGARSERARHSTRWPGVVGAPATRCGVRRGGCASTSTRSACSSGWCLPLLALEWIVAGLSVSSRRRAHRAATPCRVEAVLPGATARRLTWNVGAGAPPAGAPIRCARRSSRGTIRHSTLTSARSRRRIAQGQPRASAAAWCAAPRRLPTRKSLRARRFQPFETSAHVPAGTPRAAA